MIKGVEANLGECVSATCMLTCYITDYWSIYTASGGAIMTP